jgi:hypothetical protein
MHSINLLKPLDLQCANRMGDTDGHPSESYTFCLCVNTGGGGGKSQEGPHHLQLLLQLLRCHGIHGQLGQLALLRFPEDIPTHWAMVARGLLNSLRERCAILASLRNTAT